MEQLHYQYFLAEQYVSSDGRVVEPGDRSAFESLDDSSIYLMRYGMSGMLAMSAEQVRTHGKILTLSAEEIAEADAYISRRDAASRDQIMASRKQESALRSLSAEETLQEFLALPELQADRERLHALAAAFMESKRASLPELEKAEEEAHGRYMRISHNERYQKPGFSDLIAIVEYCRREKPRLFTLPNS